MELSNDILVFDVETGTHNNGAWNDPRNELVCIAYDDVCVRPTKECLEAFQERVHNCRTLVAFNAKFDLHWIANAGIDFSGKRVYDIQYLEYILSGQSLRYPSLNEVAFKYLKEQKIDKIKEYWNQGIQTTDIPWEELKEYAIQDVALTRKLYEVMELPPKMKNLFSLGCQDLLVLWEMERNGIKYNRAGSLKKAEEYEKLIEEIKQRNNLEHGIPDFNWNSPDQIGALLFGGSIFRTVKVPNGFVKSGPNKGKLKFKNESQEYKLPRRYKPVKQTESGKNATDDDTLVKLGTEGLVGDIQQIRRLQKEVSTYLRGIPAKQDEGMYGTDRIYGQFNQCVTGTGRLSSSNPNLQNMSEACLEFCESSYE